jgi:AcrR family transcriptional regulator
MPLTSLQAIVSPRKKPSQARAQRTLDTLFEATAQVLMQQGEAGFTTNRVAER